MRQYVGARYVPKFYENSQNPLSCEWEANVNYEALTVVVYMSDTYTSKKRVPLTVGNPRDNGEYWALTGEFNAQLEQYREEVLAVEAEVAKIGDLDDLETLEKDDLVKAINSTLSSQRKFAIFSDSYGQTNFGVAPYTTHLVNLVSHATTGGWYTFAESGAGIKRAGSLGYNANSLITAHLSDIPNKDEITDVVLAFGINDRVQDLTDLHSYFTTTNTTIKTNFPNARIWLAWLGNQLKKSDSEYTGYLNCIRRYEEEATTLGWLWCEGVQYIMHDVQNVKTDSDDYIHPSVAGSTRLAYGLAQILNGNAYKYFMRYETTLKTLADTSITVHQTIDGNMTNTWVSEFYNSGSFADIMGSNGGQKIATVQNSRIDYHMSQKQTVQCWAQGSSHNFNSTMLIFKNNGEIFSNIYSTNSAKETISAEYFTPFGFSVPTVLF